MSEKPSTLSTFLKKEAAVFLALLFAGLVLLPAVIWFVGHAVFGAYDGAGYSDFFGTLSGKIRSGNLNATRRFPKTLAVGRKPMVLTL